MCLQFGLCIKQSSVSKQNSRHSSGGLGPDSLSLPCITALPDLCTNNQGCCAGRPQNKYPLCSVSVHKSTNFLISIAVGDAPLISTHQPEPFFVLRVFRVDKEVWQVVCAISQDEALWLIRPLDAHGIKKHGPSCLQPAAKPVTLVACVNCFHHSPHDLCAPLGKFIPDPARTSLSVGDQLCAGIVPFTVFHRLISYHVNGHPVGVAVAHRPRHQVGM